MSLIPEGTVLRANGEIYVVLGGERQRVVDPEALRELGLGDQSGEEAAAATTGDVGVLTLPGEEVERIPQGQDFSIQGVIQKYTENEVVSDSPRRYMATDARVSQENGRIDATTRTWTRQPWWGFTGGVCVLLGRGDGEIVHNTDLHWPLGVDGFRIGRWTRQDYWTQYIPVDRSRQVQTLEIVHVHAPKNRFFERLEDIKRTAKYIADIAEQLRRIRFQ